ncbi:hypothetical protein Nepgr_002258 [Nepenthes gracilis]|uniref:Clu domain-containing protein n=1 Tax=Nepenthes gracilis TaxID=150966 RepID=A0AAD3P5X5_NEPGR|nr:hypothetical protein Nepgr_002258 [Nepenthes gracilis]
MAPKNGRGKTKGERKKKEEKILPTVMDITVNLPDEIAVILKGISTDKIIDVRKLLSVNIHTCNITNFSLSHEVRGPRLKDTVDVSALKPCVLALVQEDYDEESAAAHVRRLLDIVACTTSFGPSAHVKDSNNVEDGKSVRGALDTSSAKKSGKSNKQSPTPATTDITGTAKTPPPSTSKDDLSMMDEEGEMISACLKLGSFHEFFSLSHLTPPLQFIRRASRQQDDQILADDHLFFINVKLCNGKMILVEACKRGFLSFGKHHILSHNLVDLLRQHSRAFDKAYDDLMRAFTDRNKFGNLPFGFRANSWLIPPAAAQSPSTFPPLPVEDETWGGNGGGLGRDGSSDLTPWANEFQFVASMPCKTAEERQLRDRKAFIIHSLFVDVAIFRATSILGHVMENSTLTDSNVNDEILYTERVGDMCITIMKDACQASRKVDTKIDGLRATGLDQRTLIERNLLKGMTADENTAAHDVGSLGYVNVRYGGYIATVKVEVKESTKVRSPSPSVDNYDQPEGGANALNINSLRLLLHKGVAPEHRELLTQSHCSEDEKLTSAQALVENLLEEGLVKLQEEKVEPDNFVRWELGACWLQHLQDQKNSEKDKKPSIEKAKSEMRVQGLGTSLRSLKNKKAEGSSQLLSEISKSHANGVNSASPSADSQNGTSDNDAELALRKVLSDGAFTRLKESETGLHRKSLQELIDLSQKYYDEVALPKLVADFGSLELSPVDGRTLTDFMHTRGLRMRSLGCVVKLSEKLSHVQSLCIHEMIVRAYKHILQAAIASVSLDDMAVIVAAALNMMLGVPGTRASDQSCNVHILAWKWLELFLLKRYNWDISGFNCRELRKFAILRGLCQKVGIELIPRDYDMNSPIPFRRTDIVSLIPIHKQAACSSADGRQLLESSKMALDKGKLEDAVNYGTKALAKLIAVCGPYHRMTAGAYSLLAVVLYHTGDFNQATIYQQKALDINERELGFDHPDTMKSYGDLAVFYYRLQHTELALKYVKRALYLLHLTCGPSHPNTAATYINVAMMEEGLGNVHVALRYLQKALKCNQRLLGPDHIQTAASYHAIAIALSLMEAYPLSVQHEQTTLKILRAKLGPDDLRTQDAAAWLEYFESKAFEQQEAARNGTRKPDASIASKGHLSVSDLLDYINPSPDGKGRNSAAVKRKSYPMKVKETFNQSSSKPSSEGSPRDTPVAASSEEKETDEYVNATDEASSEDSTPVQPEELVVETAEEKKLIDSDQVLSEPNPEGEDGWQPVQRPRSAGSCGHRLKQRRSSIGKVFGYQKREVVSETNHARQNYSNQNSRYYIVKKWTLSPGNHPDQHTAKSSPQVNKFGRRIVKAVTYRVKYAPSSPKVDPKEALCTEDEVGQTFEKKSIASLGKSPSYKDVALAPPGTVSKFPTWVCQDNIHDEEEFDFGKSEDAIDDNLKVKSIAVNTEAEVENVKEIKEYCFSDLEDRLASEIDIAERMEENQFNDLARDNNVIPVAALGGVDGIDSYTIDIHEVALESLERKPLTCETDLPHSPSSTHSPIEAHLENVVEEGHFKKVVSCDSEQENTKKMIETRDGPSKKLSASAAPFSPSTASTRAAALAVNINLLSEPAASPSAGPWPLSMSLHPVPATLMPTFNPLCSSPHHGYPSPPTPTMIQPLPFMYPPYTQAPPMPTIAFPVGSNHFHRNHYAWQRNMNPGTPDFIPATVWPACHPVELPVLPHAAEPISDPVTEQKVQSLNSENSPTLAPLLPDDINAAEAKRAVILSETEEKREVTLSASESTNDVNKSDLMGSENEEEKASSNPCAKAHEGTSIYNDNLNENLASSGVNNVSDHCWEDSERTLSILIRGRRNRKQTLRVPLSLLRRPYSSHSFKIGYSRVIRDGETPRSVLLSSSGEDSSA